jgi:hypothetical protein
VNVLLRFAHFGFLALLVVFMLYIAWLIRRDLNP